MKKPTNNSFINIPICIEPEPTIYTTGANLRPMTFVCDGREKWMWVVVEFVDDSFKDGDVYNPPECAATKDELLTDTTSEGDYEIEREPLIAFDRVDRKTGGVVVFNDRTILGVSPPESGVGKWSIVPIAKGILFDRIEPCRDEGEIECGNCVPPPQEHIQTGSDIVFFKNGIKWRYFGNKGGVLCNSK